MNTSNLLARGLVAAAGCLAMVGASATPVTWTDWTSLGGDLKSAAGNMGGIGVTVGASFVMDGASQLSGASTCGLNNYWTEPNPSDLPYTGGSVSNAPTACEQIGLSTANSLTVSFSSAVNVLYMALLSVGQRGLAVTYDFDKSFTIDSEGQGYWGNDSTNGIVGVGDTLTMSEFHGVLRFSAPVTSLTFTTNPGEYWHAFTFGMVEANAGTQGATPEPGSLALVGAALLAAGALRRKAA